MAKIPTISSVNKTTDLAIKEEEKKVTAQAEEGKAFVNLGQGVIPEEIWKNLPGKKIEDAEAVK